MSRAGFGYCSCFFPRREKKNNVKSRRRERRREMNCRLQNHELCLAQLYMVHQFLVWSLSIGAIAFDNTTFSQMHIQTLLSWAWIIFHLFSLFFFFFFSFFCFFFFFLLLFLFCLVWIGAGSIYPHVEWMAGTASGDWSRCQRGDLWWTLGSAGMLSSRFPYGERKRERELKKRQQWFLNSNKTSCN